MHCSGFSEDMIIIADEARASDDDSVTAESFLICRIRLWHAPSQDGGNLFICAEESGGKGGQLASAIRQLSDKQYITVRDSQTNERGSRNVHPGQTQFYNQPGTLITLYSGWHMHSSPHVHCLPHQHLFCHLKSQRNDCHVKYYPTEPCESMINQTDSVYS